MDAPFKACSIKGCNGNAHWKTRGALGYCNAHYKRIWRYGDPLGGSHRADNSGSCSIQGCDSNARTAGLCNAHYFRSRIHGSPLGGGTLRGEPERFFREVVLIHSGDECLTWPFARNRAGYGRMFAKDGGTTLVSRRVCEEVNGPPPTPDHQAAHSCGKGHEGCVSPLHVSWKLPIENSADTIIHGTSLIKARGESHHNAHLTENDVRNIRANRGKETINAVAASYGVKSETIKAIYSRRTWRSL